MAVKNVESRFNVLNTMDDGKSIIVELKEEDHTLGNALRYIINKNEDVKFCGYSLPHPNEKKILLQIQMASNCQMKAIDALDRGLRDLMKLSEHIKSAWDDAVCKGTSN